MSDTGHIKVFIVDDDDAVRDSLETVLGAAGWRVETFCSANEFLDGCDLADGDSVVVTDVRMPGMDGLELQSRVMERRPGIPFIVMTGHGDVPMAVQAMKAGATDFIEKPFDAEMLMERIEHALKERGGQARDGDAARAEVEARMVNLTPREKDVLRHLVAGRPNKIIAYELNMHEGTVKVHIRNIMKKLNARNRTEVAFLISNAFSAV